MGNRPRSGLCNVNIIGRAIRFEVSFGNSCDNITFTIGNATPRDREAEGREERGGGEERGGREKHETEERGVAREKVSRTSFFFFFVVF